ncbi:hypothetical protein ACSQ67_014584 [Phaseolus vulgaris]
MQGMSGSYLQESPGTGNSSPNLPTSEANEGHEVKEALRAQMEVQSKLHLLVEAEKHLQIRQDAERRYMGMLERALCSEVGGMHVSEVAAILHPQGADCSTESCLTSLESLGGLTLEGSPGGSKKRMLSLDSMVAPLIWSEANTRTQGIHLGQVNPPGITRYGM